MSKLSSSSLALPLVVETPWGQLNCTLRRSAHRRTLEIRISEQAEIRVAAPFYVSLDRVQDFLLKNARWIKEKHTQHVARLADLAQRKYEEGHQFLFLGKEYPLSIIEEDVRQPRIRFHDERWEIVVSKELRGEERALLVKKKLTDWYRGEAGEIFGGRIFHYSRKMGVEPEAIAVKTQKRMWGNCDHRARKINLNWRLVMSPLEVIDYVVVHELCHLRVPNHSRKFWREVAAILPDFKCRQQWLKANTDSLSLP